MNSQASISVLYKSFVLLILLTVSLSLKGQTIAVNPVAPWVVQVAPVVQPGGDYSGTYDSNNNLFTLSGHLPGSFLNLLSSKSIPIKIRVRENNWHKDLSVFARKKGGKTSIKGICVLCGSSIQGVETYQRIPSNASVTFFSINFSGLLGLANSLDFSDVQVQLQVQGVSVTLPVDSYTATLEFTIESP